MKKYKKLIRAISLFLGMVFMFSIVGCSSNSKNGNSNLPAFNRERYFYGGAELASEVGPKGDWRDSGTNMEWTSNTAKALGIKVQRVWMHLNTVLVRAETSNEISVIRDECDRYHQYFAMLKAAGVERIVVMNHRFLYPYGYKAGTAATAPEPDKDPEIYKQWLEMYSECYRLLAQEFPEIDFWECGNEFDLDNFLHKTNHSTDKMNSLFPENEAAAITADLCYAARKGLRSVNRNKYVVLPGMSGYAKESYFESIYTAIESKKYPTIEDTYITDPDEYFDVIAWHCYPMNTDIAHGDYDNALITFKERCLGLYDVAKRHGDGEKRVWFTEIGIAEGTMGDVGEESTLMNMADYAMRIFDIIEKDLSFVETVFWFRYSDVCTMNLSGNEGCFGIFYSADDTVNRGKPKPIAIALYKRINGENADVSPLYWYSDKYGIER